MKPVWRLIAVLLGLSGCVANVRDAQLINIPLAQKPVIPTTEASCEAAGQFWTTQGLPGGNKTCAVKTTDARKICTDSLQCQGACLVEDSLTVGSNAIGSCSE